ncbi:MAG: hypothetical protein R2824_19970 [Saprospiraceae bacterium]
MATIHEDDIKRVALGFLRSYYKHRPRSDEMRTAVNMRGEGGIIVDSYLSYTDPEGDAFIATAEATSVDTRDEVKFSVQIRLLFWDSMVFGTLMGILYYLGSSWVSWLSMPVLNPTLRAITVLLVIVILAMIYRFGLRPLRRYRYIYAIAQFKKYHADEQWVALAKAVFPLLDENPYYRELKRQCTRFGFGLILVDNQLQPRLVISPAKEEIFDRQREAIKLFSLKNYTRLQELGNKDWLPIKWWRNWTNPYRDQDYFRFRSGFKHQGALIAFGLVIIATLHIKELKRMPVYHPNEVAYSKQMEQEAEHLKKEEGLSQDPKPFVVPFGEENKEEDIIGLNEEEEEVEVITVKPEAEVIIYDPFNQNLIFYDCERLYNFTETKYFIKVGEYGDRAATEKELQILGDVGIHATAFWEGCFSPNGTAFILYVDDLYDSSAEARFALDSLDVKLRQVKLQPEIQPISPLINYRY